MYASSTSRTCAPLRFVQFIRKDKNKHNELGLLDYDNATLHILPHKISDRGLITFLHDDFNEFLKILNTLSTEKLTDNIEILPPVTNPEKIMCIGLNYTTRMTTERHQEPIFFSKFASALVGHRGKVIAHKVTNELDYEVELAVVIGKEAKNVSKQDAFDYVFGYTVAQDISARDWQKSRNGGQFLMGKSMDTFCPLGPGIVHKSIVSDPHNLKITTRINGVLRQNSNTKRMVLKINDIIQHLTRAITLKPGDIILTGTPPGVGMQRNPPAYLKPGDVIESEIESIGKLIVTVVEDT